MKLFFKETIFSVLLSILLIFALSIVISKTTVSENVIIPGIIVISSFSIMFGSIRVSRKRERNGMVNGTILGLIYMGSMYIISSIILKDFSITANSIIMVTFGIICGGIGGILGVNFKK